MAWRPLGLVVFLTLAACSSPEDPPTVPSDPALPGGGGSNTGDPGSGNPGESDAGTSDAGTGTPSDGGIQNNDAGIPNNDAGIPNNDAGIPNNDAGIPNNDAGIPSNDAGFAASLQTEDCVPWTGAQPPQEASPCEVTYQSSSPSTHRPWPDAQGPDRDAELSPRATVRTTYLCGTALKHHVDTDRDGDGTVDARCTYTRDARGALVREECFSLPADPSQATSTDYRYDCQ